jgi:hypothetical protein
MSVCQRVLSRRQDAEDAFQICRRPLTRSHPQDVDHHHEDRDRAVAAARPPGCANPDVPRPGRQGGGVSRGPRPGADIATLTKADPEKVQPGISRGPQPAVYGPTFEHVAQPCKPIIGVVKDKATGKPLTGVGVNGSAPNHWWGDYAQTKTDADGQFRLVGVAKASHYTVRAYAGQPYLPSQLQVADSEGLKPVTVDFEVVRGVQVKGRITDKETGKPVYCALWYFPLADNKFFKDLPGKEAYHFESISHDRRR